MGHNEATGRTDEHYLATLIGCAVGDALGMPVEGWKREQILKYVGRIDDMIDPVIVRDSVGNKVTEDEFGKLRYWTEDFRKGEYTDDTILALALAESIATVRGLDLNDVAVRQLETYTSRRRTDGSVKGGFGGTTMLAFKNLETGVSPLESGVIGGPGNGPAMKMAPLGMYMHATGKYDEGLRFAELVGRITHRDPRSVASGVVQAHAVYAALQGLACSTFVDSVVNVCCRFENPLTTRFTAWKQGGLRRRLEWIKYNRNVDPQVAHEHLGSSSNVYQSYPFALFMFQKYWDDPINGLIETVNYGGDCDTTGAMFGALAGARHGMVFPARWESKLQGLEPLVRAAKQISSLRSL
ncbi:ADP-ribosylglycohydrolase family protein [Candidatus Woesearchaeota archaeon]|nr:ADP-ribosylglycohydrolase family protein [Candidatus Woesearchaeota archaeon]